MILSRTHGFAFVHLLKTAGESVEAAYEPHATWRDLVLGGSPSGESLSDAYRARWGLWKHATAAEIRDVIGRDEWSRLYRFSVVREPVARAVSLYTYLCGMRDSLPLRDRARWSITGRSRTLPWLGPAIHESTDFASWLRHPNIRRAVGMRPQAHWLYDGDTLLVDEVLRFEDLREGWPRIAARIGLPGLVLPHRNASRSQARPTVTADDRRLIRELAAEDYERFGYPDPAV